MRGFLVLTRPATLAELAESLDAPLGRLEQLVRRHGIAPICRIGGTGWYGPAQVRQIVALIQSTAA